MKFVDLVKFCEIIYTGEDVVNLFKTCEIIGTVGVFKSPTSNYFEYCQWTCEGYFQNSLHQISYFRFFFDLHFLGLKPKFVIWKTTKYSFPWTWDSQCQNSTNSLAKNTPNLPKFYQPNLSPQAQKLRIFEKNSLWEAVVHNCEHQNQWKYEVVNPTS